MTRPDKAAPEPAAASGDRTPGQPVPGQAAHDAWWDAVPPGRRHPDYAPYDAESPEDRNAWDKAAHAGSEEVRKLLGAQLQSASRTIEELTRELGEARAERDRLRELLNEARIAEPVAVVAPREQAALDGHLTMRFPPGVAATVKRIAMAEGMGVSAWIRREIEREVGRREAAAQPAPEPAAAVTVTVNGEPVARTGSSTVVIPGDVPRELVAAMAETRHYRELLDEIGVMAANAPEDGDSFGLLEEIAMRIAAHGVPEVSASRREQAQRAGTGDGQS